MDVLASELGASVPNRCEPFSIESSLVNPYQLNKKILVPRQHQISLHKSPEVHEKLRQGRTIYE